MEILLEIVLGLVFEGSIEIVKSKKANSYYFHNNYNIKNAIEIYSVSGVLGRVLPQLVSSLLLHFSSCRA